MRVKICSLLILGLVISSMSGVWAAGGKAVPENAQRVELFKAVKDGLVEVRLTPKSSLECTVSLTNKGKSALMVDMPAAFAGVPVLAQPPGAGMFGDAGGFGDAMGGGGRRGGMGGSSGSSGGNQSFGGGMGGGGGGGMGGMGGGGGWFVPAEKTVKERVRTVCLEHGKKEPRATMNYTMVPIASYTKNKTTQVLCTMLADQSIDQLAVQAAVWNQENEMTFQELAKKTVKKPGRPFPRAFFTPSQIAMGQKAVQAAMKRVEQMDENARLHGEKVELSSEKASATYQTDDTGSDKKTESKVDQLTEKLLSK